MTVYGDAQVKLVVNGEQADSKAETLQELLGELRIKPERVAVEVNLSIIKKSDYGSYKLKDGDRIEIVNFVGGGQWKTS
jgi:thiamine biosynthesis protein ThiS